VGIRCLERAAGSDIKNQFVLILIVEVAPCAVKATPYAKTFNNFNGEGGKAGVFDEKVHKSYTYQISNPRLFILGPPSGIFKSFFIFS
jgi:hypothetical protein